jgi:hypothetical protein
MLRYVRNILLCDLRQDTWLCNICNVNEDVIRRMPVQRCAEPILVKIVADETNAATEYEKPIEGANLAHTLIW